MESAAFNASILDLFWKADLVVKIVMAILAAASIWSWAVVIEKLMQFSNLDVRANLFEKRFWSGASLEDLEEARIDSKNDAMARVFMTGAREWREMRRAGAISQGQAAMLQDRCDRLMQAAIQRETAYAAKGLPVLASVGSSAPFIGLFGTVWGIMHSFKAIGVEKSADFAVVAPGIAEALLATALGLAAAIPAVIFYNKFAGDLDRFAERLENFADEFGARLSRRLSERAS